METEIDVVLAPELMAGDRMVHCPHVAPQIARHAETRIVAILIGGVARKGVVRMVHRSEVMTIDEARRMSGMVVVIEDRADLRTWIATADLRKAETNHAAPARAATAVVNLAKAKLAMIADLRLAEAMVEEKSDLQREADVLRSLVEDQVALRGLRDEKVAHRLAVAHRLGEDLRRWDHRGHNAASHLAVDHRSETVDHQDAHQWDHPG